MKLNIKKSLLISIGMLTLWSCDSDFAEMNTDPTRPIAKNMDPNLILPTTLNGYANVTAGYSGAILFQSMWIQLLASTSSGGATYYSNGDKYVRSSGTNGYVQTVWDDGYKYASFANQMTQLALTKNQDNLANIGIIVKILNISFISDVYGDIPYSQALKITAKTPNKTRPAYDKQSELYPNILAELDKAIVALDKDGTSPTYDIVYGGDISKWKKFGYSLMLKLASRLVKADPKTAQEYITKATTGGVFTSSDDDAIVLSDYANTFNNSGADALDTNADIMSVHWSKTFIDYMKINNDPRLKLISEVALKESNKDGSEKANVDYKLDKQIGLPNGLDESTNATSVEKEPNYPGEVTAIDKDGKSEIFKLGNYSRPSVIFRDRDAPFYILTYAETELLLADAAARGLTVSGNAATHYANGLKGAMLTLNKWVGSNPTNKSRQLTDSEINTYVTGHPLLGSNPLKMINEQIWASVGMWANFVEAWSNWRKSGYPELTPVNYQSNFSGGKIPTREIYPLTEGSLNPDNYKKAVTNMGGEDNWTTEVWWAKKK